MPVLWQSETVLQSARIVQSQCPRLKRHVLPLKVAAGPLPQCIEGHQEVDSRMMVVYNVLLECFLDGDEHLAYFVPLFQYNPVSTWDVLQNPAAVWSLRSQRCLRRWVNAQRRWRLNRCGCAKSNIARVWRTLKNWSHTPFPSLSSFWVTRQVRCWNPNSILELPKWQCRMPKIIHKQIKARKGERQIDHPISPALFIAHPAIWCSGCRLWIWADCWSGLLCWWPQYFKVVCSKCK